MVKTINLHTGDIVREEVFDFITTSVKMTRYHGPDQENVLLLLDGLQNVHTFPTFDKRIVFDDFYYTNSSNTVTGFSIYNDGASVIKYYHHKSLFLRLNQEKLGHSIKRVKESWTLSHTTNVIFDLFLFFFFIMISDPTASLGRVLGTRQVLYKYLDINLISITTYTGSDSRVYILNSITGSIIYHVTLENSNTIKMILCENWFLATHSRGETNEILVVEFYDSLEADTRDERYVVMKLGVLYIDFIDKYVTHSTTQKPIQSRKPSFFR